MTIEIPVNITCVSDNTIQKSFEITYTSEYLHANDFCIYFNFFDYNFIKSEIFDIINFKNPDLSAGEITYLIKEFISSATNEYWMASVIESVDIRFYTFDAYSQWWSEYIIFKRRNIVDSLTE